jgi:hypothetical protein
MAKFSKKHHVAVAAVLKSEFSKALASDQKEGTSASWERMLSVQDSFARMFESDNESFNASWFIAHSEPN